MTTYLGKSCSFCLPRVPFVNCRQFMYLVISLLVLRAGYGIWLYQFLIIAYLFTLHFIIYYIILLHTDVPYSTSLSFEESVTVSHISPAGADKAFVNLSCVLGCLVFGWCRSNPKYQMTDAICAQQPTTLAFDLHVQYRQWWDLFPSCVQSTIYMFLLYNFERIYALIALSSSLLSMLWYLFSSIWCSLVY